jgi:hypothetical protein
MRFLEVASDDRLFAMWHVFVTTGMRRSEVAALLWRNVDLDTGLLSVTRAAVEVKGKVHERELTKSSSSAGPSNSPSRTWACSGNTERSSWRSRSPSTVLGGRPSGSSPHRWAVGSTRRTSHGPSTS